MSKIVPSTEGVRLDQSDPKANMYGCLPCPKCQSEYRWPTSDRHPTDPMTILCDDCEFKEKHRGHRDD